MIVTSIRCDSMELTSLSCFSRHVSTLMYLAWAGP